MKNLLIKMSVGLALFGGLNGALWIVQDVAYRDTDKQHEKIVADLDSKLQNIKLMESELTSLHNDITAANVDTTSESAVYIHNQKVNRYNTLFKSYEQELANYNAQVEAANNTRTRRIYFVPRHKGNP